MGFSDKFLLGVWNVGIIERAAEQLLQENGNIEIRWMRHPYRDRFFADPFLFSVDAQNYYILAEEYPFYTNVGVISMLKIDRKTMRLLEKQTVLSGPCHLSYPFVYGNTVIPEAFRSERCVAYQVENQQVAAQTTVASFGLIDQTFLQYDGKEWIFATDKDNKLCGLKIFYREIGETDWHAHSGNPVKSDIRTARPGGHFFRIGNDLYRPVQDSEKRYGHRIRIMRVDELTPNTFRETEVKLLSADGNPPYDMGFHTFNAEDGFVVVDGYREYKSYFVKPMCLKAKPIMRFFGERK